MKWHFIGITLCAGNKYQQQFQTVNFKKPGNSGNTVDNVKGEKTQFTFLFKSHDTIYYRQTKNFLVYTKNVSSVVAYLIRSEYELLKYSTEC